MSKLVTSTTMSNPYEPPQHNDDPVEEGLQAEIRGMQIITVAMAGGAMFFMFVALMANQGELGFVPDITSWIGLGFAAIAFVVHFIAPDIAARQTLNQVDREQLKSTTFSEQIPMILGACRQRLIIGAALLEGAAFINLVFYMTDKYIGNLAAAAFSIVCIVLKLPTAPRVTDWARQRIQEIELRSSSAA